MSLDVQLEVDGEFVFTSNITHNLAMMAKEAGIYMHLWRPGEIGANKAKDLIQPLKDGICKMIQDPKKFKEFDDEHLWGTYKQFLPWIMEYLDACIEYPEATVSVWR